MGELVVADVFGPFDLISDRAHQLYADGDPAAAVRACDEALPLVRAAGDVATERFLCYSRGVSLRELGRYAEVVAQSQELLVLAADDPLWRAKALALLAEASAVLGSTSTALDHVAEGLDLVDAGPGGYNRLSARMALAITLEALSLHGSAEEVFLDLLDPREPYREFVLEEACALRAAWAAGAGLLGEDAEAGRHHLAVAERALGLRRAAEAAGDAHAVVRADVYLALALQSFGDDDAAWSLVGDPGVLDVLSPAGTDRLVALVVRGRALLRRGDTVGARPLLERAVELGRRSRRDVWRWAAVEALADLDVVEHGDHPAVSRYREHVRGLLRRLRRDSAGRAAELVSRRRVRQLEDERDGVHRAALTDPLTGLGNRRALLQVLETAPELLGAVFVDVDHFKDVNDRFSHDAGDRVLVRVAEMLVTACRSSELVVRYGGDEFVVLVVDEPSVAEAIAHRVLEAVRAHDWEQIAPGLRVTVSVGVEAGAAVASALSSADSALYAAKRGGRDRIVVAAPGGTPSPDRGELPGPRGVRLPPPTASTDDAPRTGP
ncbi:GGDEF domain-containing protein [Pseudokineococcus marinus]|uniref:GGDEF domain-containing protein n=1 Tax=Pseudokineococcus marinus TaxID=351215 RepID=A0A849BZP0_9ACTN|nr:GGDEF domain-containing protein [Pseudokineococcus marinus]NNH22938.1 GGDEF domain-containing protein [Pseudokineococcus marinus]